MNTSSSRARPEACQPCLRLLNRITTVLSLATCLGCDSASPASAPSPVPPPTPAPFEFSLSGTVYNTAWRPLAGALIQVVAGSGSGASAVSDLAGHYELPGPFTGSIILLAEKPGYAPVTIEHRASVSGQSQRDFVLLTPETADLAGEWSVRFEASDSCQEIPDAIRTRVYMASIERARYPPHEFSVRLRGGMLIPHWSNEILIAAAGGDARISIPAWDWGVGIAEDLGESKDLFIWGEGAGSVSAVTFVAVLEGGFEYTDHSGQSTIKCESFQLAGVRR